MNRRHFLKTVGCVAGALALGTLPTSSVSANTKIESYEDRLRRAMRSWNEEDLHLGVFNSSGECVGTGLLPRWPAGMTRQEYVGRIKVCGDFPRRTRTEVRHLEYDDQVVVSGEGCVYEAVVDINNHDTITHVALLDSNKKILHLKEHLPSLMVSKGDTVLLTYEIYYDMASATIKDNIPWGEDGRPGDNFKLGDKKL